MYLGILRRFYDLGGDCVRRLNGVHVLKSFNTAGHPITNIFYTYVQRTRIDYSTQYTHRLYSSISVSITERGRVGKNLRNDRDRVLWSQAVGEKKKAPHYQLFIWLSDTFRALNLINQRVLVLRLLPIKVANSHTSSTCVFFQNSRANCSLSCF